MKKKSRSRLAYENTSNDTKFREQYRFAFSVAVVATVFIVPNENALEQFLKLALGFSAFFAALYLITSAARVKYKEPGRMYEVFYVGERFRMWTFDWSVNVFAAAFLYFIGLFITGLINIIFNVNLGPVLSWVMPLVLTLIVGLIILLITHMITSRTSVKIKSLPKL